MFVHLISTGEVKLDADTNHRLLVVSDNGLEVRRVQTLQDFPGSSKRFEKSPYVIGTKELKCGKAYYEVRVKGKTGWTLGLMQSNKINRKESVYFCSKGHFSIGLLHGNYNANPSPAVVRLCLSEKLKMVGVFVDYDEGQIVFYNAKTGSLLCSFQGLCFRESLYPMFSPGSFKGNTNPLIINPE